MICTLLFRLVLGTSSCEVQFLSTHSHSDTSALIVSRFSQSSDLIRVSSASMTSDRWSILRLLAQKAFFRMFVCFHTSPISYHLSLTSRTRPSSPLYTSLCPFPSRPYPPHYYQTSSAPASQPPLSISPSPLLSPPHSSQP